MKLSGQNGFKDSVTNNIDDLEIPGKADSNRWEGEYEYFYDEDEEDDYWETEAVCQKSSKKNRNCQNISLKEKHKADIYAAERKKLKKESNAAGNKKKVTGKKNTQSAKKAAGTKSSQRTNKAGRANSAAVKPKQIKDRKRRPEKRHMDAMDRIVAATGALIMVFAVVTCSLYANAKLTARQVASFEEVGREMEGITVIGESGLLAMADAKSRMALEEAVTESSEVETEYDEKELSTKGSVEVEMHLSSMQKDLKIKFINKKTGKLVPNVSFEANITGPDKKSYVLKDDDMDGIIYKTDVTPGKCSVAMKEIKDTKDAGKYIISTESVSVTVKDKIEYKKVDVVDEVKKESEVNAAIEDTKKQNTTVESALTDTVGWVESAKNPVSGDSISDDTGMYEEVSKDKITDPLTLTSMGTFIRFAAVNEAVDPAGTPNGQDSGTAGQPEASDGGNVPQEIKVALNASSYSVKTGETFTITAATEPEGNALIWSSTNTAVASVQNGVVTTLGEGTADITAVTATGNSAVCKVTVTQAEVNTPSVTISSAAEKLLTGKTVQLLAEVKNTEDKSVIWRSDADAVAIVSSDGTVTGVSAGTANIYAISNADNNITAKCEITVKVSPEKDVTTKLKDNDGNQLYVADGNGKFREAVYSDYYTTDKFYKRTQNVEYKYTGWQTIDGKTYYFNQDGNKVTGEQIIQGAKYNFDSEGVLSTASGNMGIDVSKWNGNIDWNAVKNSGVSYVIIRCGYRGSTTGALIEDPKFRSNIQGASAAGLKVGIYFFTQAVNEIEAVEEASMVAGMISGYRISYPVFLDVEPSGGRADGISQEARTAVCRAFCQTIQNSGYTAGIYANNTWLTTHINAGSLSNYKIWLAQYAAAPTYSATRYDMWQYSAKGSVAGISGNVDMNISYLGY